MGGKNEIWVIHHPTIRDGRVPIIADMKMIETICKMVKMVKDARKNATSRKQQKKKQESNQVQREEESDWSYKNSNE